MRQHSYFGVTHSENSEVQIAVFSKWNILWGWKLVQRFIFYLSSTSNSLFFAIWWRHCENHQLTNPKRCRSLATADYSLAPGYLQFMVVWGALMSLAVGHVLKILIRSEVTHLCHLLKTTGLGLRYTGLWLLTPIIGYLRSYQRSSKRPLARVVQCNTAESVTDLRFFSVI